MLNGIYKNHYIRPSKLNDLYINIMFEKTKLQIIAYNEHNGYYPKTIKVNLGQKKMYKNFDFNLKMNFN